ncbi:MAG: NTPase [Candidatus Bathyarchaeia archaeon]
MRQETHCQYEIVDSALVLSVSKSILFSRVVGKRLLKRLLFLTGSPGVGKTTILLRVVEALKAKGYGVGGMISREVRCSGVRVGFEIMDLCDSAHGWLAHVSQQSGPQVGRYRVSLKDLDSVGVRAIVRAVEDLDVVVVDEVGPMELFSAKFQDAVGRAVESLKLVIGVVHLRARSRLIDEVKGRADFGVYVVTPENRDSLHEAVVEKAVEFLEHA